MTEELLALDLDEELIGHLTDPDTWLRLRAEQFRPELILDPETREEYRWADRYYRENKEVPTPAVWAEEYEREIYEPQIAIGDLLYRLRVRFAEMQTRKSLESLAKTYLDDPLRCGREMVQQGKALGEVISRKGEMFGTGDGDRALELYEAKALLGAGPSLGFPELDAYFFGQRGLTILLGPPKSFKSWMMTKMTLANVEVGNHTWLYSLELPAEETDMRLRCLNANLPWHRYMHNNFSRQDKKKLAAESAKLDGLGVYVCIKPPEGERSLEDLVVRAKDSGADVVFIDQLQYIEHDGRSLGAWNDTGRYFAVLNQARNLSDEIPICIAHQFNRSVMNSKEMPSVQQAKGSSAIEETATLCLGVFASREMRESKQAQLGTLASRNHDYRTWWVDVKLKDQCTFEIAGIVEEDDL